MGGACGGMLGYILFLHFAFDWTFLYQQCIFGSWNIGFLFCAALIGMFFGWRVDVAERAAATLCKTGTSAHQETWHPAAYSATGIIVSYGTMCIAMWSR